jgi:predicted DNA-binding ribbon-helix-helix protein
MPVLQPPTGPIEVSDPNNVPETFVNGPFNIVKTLSMMHLTFTASRPNTNDLFKGSTTPGFQATVTCRLLMPLETAEQLSRTLAEVFSKAAQPTDTRPQIIKLTDPPGKGKKPRPRETGGAGR